MGGGGYDHWDWEAKRERDEKEWARSHVCKTVEEKISNITNTEQLCKLLSLIEDRIHGLNAQKELEKERAQKEAAYQKELKKVEADLRRKHGL